MAASHPFNCQCSECAADRAEVFAGYARMLAACLGLGVLNCRSPEHPSCRNREDGCADCASEATPATLAIIVHHLKETVRDALAAARTAPWPAEAKFQDGAHVRVKPSSRAAEWEGHICGWYRAPKTPLGYAVHSSAHFGAVHIYAETQLEPVNHG